MSEPRGPKTWTPPPDRMLQKPEPLTPRQREVLDQLRKEGHVS